MFPELLGRVRRCPFKRSSCTGDAEPSPPEKLQRTIKVGPHCLDELPSSTCIQQSHVFIEWKCGYAVSCAIWLIFLTLFRSRCSSLVNSANESSDSQKKSNSRNTKLYEKKRTKKINSLIHLYSCSQPIISYYVQVMTSREYGKSLFNPNEM